MADWLASNLQLRADRDVINETARKAAEARKAEQQAEAQRQAARASHN